jgi:hypothetical protein
MIGERRSWGTWGMAMPPNFEIWIGNGIWIHGSRNIKCLRLLQTCSMSKGTFRALVVDAELGFIINALDFM